MIPFIDVPASLLLLISVAINVAAVIGDASGRFKFGWDAWAHLGGILFGYAFVNLKKKLNESHPWGPGRRLGV